MDEYTLAMMQELQEHTDTLGGYSVFSMSYVVASSEPFHSEWMVSLTIGNLRLDASDVILNRALEKLQEEIRAL